MRVRFAISTRNFEIAQYFDEEELRKKWVSKDPKHKFEQAIRPLIVQVPYDRFITERLALLEPPHMVTEWTGEILRIKNIPECMLKDDGGGGKFFQICVDHVTSDNHPVWITGALAEAKNPPKK